MPGPSSVERGVNQERRGNARIRQLTVARVDRVRAKGVEDGERGFVATAAAQLIELSNRDAVGEMTISGPKKLANGTVPAFQPALTGTNSSCVERAR